MKINNINQLTIDGYLQGKLDPKAMNELEKDALDDPFLADALEGFSYSSRPVGPQLSLLQKQLEERIARHQENKNTFNFTWQRLSIAAAGAVMFLLAAILFWMKSSNVNSAGQQKQSVEVTFSSTPNAGPEPANGWKSFENYLQNNIRLPKGTETAGRITLRFTINSDGKPIDIRVKKGLTQSINKEAIRLIEDGPLWKPAANRQKATVTIELYQ